MSCQITNFSLINEPEELISQLFCFRNVDIIYTTTEDNPVTLEEMETDYDDSDGMKIQFLEVEPAQPNDLGGPRYSKIVINS